MDYCAPKGMRDFLPDEMQLREWAIDKIKKVYKKFGFVPMDSPALETLNVLEKKCGDEIAGQLYRIDDGKLALRFDLTVPLARVASSNTFRKPLKRYCIGPVWRREEPQKGRFREFFQADADIIGCSTMRAEAELIACACEAISALGFSGAKVLLNDRRIISAIAKGLLPGKETPVLRILDKREKIGNEAAIDGLVKLGAKKEDAKKLLSEISKADIKTAKSYSPEAAKDLEEILSILPNYTKAIKVELDFSLVRGLDYYTGPIFEISLGKQMGSVGGGGRYDQLLSIYGQKDTATGISLGLERLLVLMKGKKLEPSGVFVACAKPEFYAYALQIAGKLWEKGIAAQTDLNGRNLKKQLDYASSSCKFAAIVGEREKKQNKLTLRNLKSGKEELVSIKEAIATLSA